MRLERIKQICLNHCYYLFLASTVGLAALTISFAEETATASIPSDNSTLTIDHLDGSQVFFKSHSSTTPIAPLDTKLFEVKPLGKLSPKEPSASPYFLFTGKPCLQCSFEKGLFVFKPNGGKPAAYAYPGRTLEPKTKRVLLESRAFFGKCIPGRSDVLVFFQLERVDRRSSMQPSVLVAEAGKDHLEDTLLERRGPSLRKMLQLVKKRVCSEIPGETRVAESHKINIHSSSTSASPKS